MILSSNMSANIIGNAKVYLFLILLCMVFSVLSPLFATWQNVLNILLASSTLGLLAIGAAIVIASAGLDLSVGSVLALSGAVASLFLNSLPWPFILLVCLLSGIIVGFINGVLIARVGIPALIVTLGMLSSARGFALIITEGRPAYGLPDAIVFIGQGSILNIPVPIWIFLFTGLLTHLILRKTSFGSRTLCIGDNETAAFNAGINVKKHKIYLYMLSGFFAALAGLIFMGRVNAADPSSGLTYELTAITAAILGGTHLFGGKASIAGAMVGALIMGVLQNGLTLLAVPTYYQQVAIGVILILAVSLDRLPGRSSC